FSGPAVDNTLTMLLGAVAALLLFFLLRGSAKFGAAMWLSVLGFVPVWIGVTFGAGGNFYVPLVCLVAILVILSLMPVSRLRFHITDALVLLLIIVGIAALFTGDKGITFTFLFTLVTYFVAGYMLGRIVPSRVDLKWLYGTIG